MKEGSIPTFSYPEMSEQCRKEDKETSTKKIAIVSVAAVICLSLILGTILLILHLEAGKNDSSYYEKTIKTKDEIGRDIKQDIYVNTKTKEQVFRTSKITAVYDFEKGLMVIRIRDDRNKQVCYLTTLNSIGLMNPSEMENALSSMNMTADLSGNEEKRSETFEQTAVEVYNRAFLSPKAKSTCEGHPIYWMIPTGEGNGKTEYRRKKRYVTCPCGAGTSFHCFNISNNIKLCFFLTHCIPCPG